MYLETGEKKQHNHDCMINPKQAAVWFGFNLIAWHLGQNTFIIVPGQ